MQPHILKSTLDRFVRETGKEIMLAELNSSDYYSLFTHAVKLIKEDESEDLAYQNFITFMGTNITNSHSTTPGFITILCKDSFYEVEALTDEESTIKYIIK